MNSLHRVKVLGREVQVRTTASPDQVREIEAFVNSTINGLRDSMKTSDPQVIAIVALLNLAEACLQRAHEQDRMSGDVDDRAARLVRLIDEAVKTA